MKEKLKIQINLDLIKKLVCILMLGGVHDGVVGGSGWMAG
jgi:hypothetical protein